MSVQTSLNSTWKTDECAHPECDTSFTVDRAIDGSYCSDDCRLQHRGVKALNAVKNDHRWCATCFRRIKTISKPPSGYPDFVIGYQYPTEHMVVAEDARGGDGEPPRLEFTRWSCQCGNVDMSHRDEIIEDVEIEGIVFNLLTCLRELEADGPLEERADKDRLFDALRERWRDWPYAIGYALYG